MQIWRRGLIDERIQAGEAAGHFLLLGPASIDLLRQASESLAGRIATPPRANPTATESPQSTGSSLKSESPAAAATGAPNQGRKQFDELRMAPGVVAADR